MSATWPDRLPNRPALRAWLCQQAEALTAVQIRISEIPAPTGQERERAQAVCLEFETLGLGNVEQDGVGNVLGLLPGQDSSRLLVLAAHLDTVFPPGTDTRVHIEASGRLHGPGIGDNAGGLASLIGVARALRYFQWRPPVDVLFFAPVGEEGLGDLRGTRYLFDAYSRREQICAFLTLDCGQPGGLITQAVGSRRFRVTFRGPGGHSYSDFGRPSALHAACRAVTYIAGTSARALGSGTVNVGVLGSESGSGPAGTSINSIAADASFEVDLRSVDEFVLERLANWLTGALEGATADEKAWASRDPETLEYTLQTLGRRPCGALPANAPLRAAVSAAFTRLDLPIVEGEGSTDANIPLSRGVPALAMWRGGTGSGAHTVGEWYDPRGRELALEAILDVIMGI